MALILGFFAGWMIQERLVLAAGSHTPTSSQPVAIQVKGMVLYVSQAQASDYLIYGKVFFWCWLAGAVVAVGYGAAKLRRSQAKG